MDYLLSRMRAVALAAMMLGLVLCLALPAWAVQTEYATLEKRVAASESALADLGKIASRYRAIEVELALHLSAARRNEAQALTNYPDYKVTLDSLTLLTLKPSVEDTKMALERVRKRTRELESALAAWNQQVRQARDAQNEICANANKARVGSISQPTPEQITQWNDSGTRLLETHTAAVREKQKALSASWDALNSVSAGLGIQVGRLEVLLARQEEFQTAYSRLTALGATCKATCKEAEQDLARARELQKDLIDLMKKVIAIDQIGLHDELERLQQKAASATDVPSDSDRENLKDRIDSALVKLKSMTLSPTLPVVGELDYRCKRFISQTVQVDPAAMTADFQQAESVVASGRPVLSKARAALKEASSAQAGFGGLGDARSCLASLRLAQADAGETDVDTVFSLVEDLQTRLEKVERQEHLFTIRNQENRARSKEMKRMVKDARNICQTWHHVDEELAERLGRLETDQAMQNLENLLSGLAKHLGKLKEAARTLAEAVQEAEQQQKAICDRAARADSGPTPSSAELQNWHQESESGLNRVRQAMEAASRTAQVHAGLVAAQTPKVDASKRELSAVKDSLLIWIKTTADCHVQMTRAQDLLKQASEIWKQVNSEGEELESRRKANLKELSEIQAAAATLAPRLVNPATIAELNAIEARAATLAERYHQTTVVGELAPPGLYIMTTSSDLRGLGDARGTHEQKASQAMRLIKKADSALEQAKSVREATGRDRSSTAGVLAEADRCVSALAKAVSTADETVAKARQALQECGYAQVQTLLNKIAQGPDKDDLVREVEAGQKLESELESMVDEARALYRECRFNKVRPILDRALANAKCPDHKKSIKRKIELNDKRRNYEEPTIALFKEADALYRDGKYLGALDKLRQARKRTSCQRFRDSLDKKIAKVQGKIDSGESESQAQQDMDQEPEGKRSCSIKIHNDLKGKQTGPGSGWTMRSEESGKSKTVHIARIDGRWWQQYCAGKRLGAFRWLAPVCGASYTGKGGHPCTLAELKAMANKECAKWKRGP
jgi:chromosome segregation ATPase